ncbi:hypothetical protein AAD001_05835 [Colwelliaceae bacterium 6471]
MFTRSFSSVNLGKLFSLRIIILIAIFLIILPMAVLFFVGFVIVSVLVLKFRARLARKNNPVTLDAVKGKDYTID